MNDEDNNIGSLVSGLVTYQKVANTLAIDEKSTRGRPIWKKSENSDLARRINEMVDWVDQHNGNVDHIVFEANCDRILMAASSLLRIRAPQFANPMAKLDFACSVCGINILSLAWEYKSLPGATEFRAFTEGNSF